MVSIRTLEIASEKIIKDILRDFMERIDYSDFDNSFDEELYYFNKLAERPIIQTVTVSYNAGYRDANTLIKNRMRTAAVIDKTTVIMMIAKSLTEKLQGMTESNKEEIQEKLVQHQTEQFTYDQIVDDMVKFFDYDTIAASRFARTGTNFVYNRAHLNRYKDTGIIPGVRYAAHIDNRTSEICIMLNGTIWEIDDPNILTPPNHFNCYSGYTVIKTLTGDKYIKDVTTEDSVLTHKSRFKRVTDTMSRYSDELLEIKTNNRTIKVTANHPILVNKCGIHLWINAGDLTTDDEIVIIN